MTKVTGYSYFGRQNRPRSITIVIWGSVILALANGWRAFGLNDQGNLLRDLGTALDPRLGMGLAIIWAVLFIVAATALWLRRAGMRIFLPILVLVHGIYQLLLVSLFARSAASRNAWPVIGLLFTLAVIFSVWALYRPSVRWYFK